MPIIYTSYFLDLRLYSNFSVLGGSWDVYYVNNSTNTSASFLLFTFATPASSNIFLAGQFILDSYNSFISSGISIFMRFLKPFLFRILQIFSFFFFPFSFFDLGSIFCNLHCCRAIIP